MKELKRGSFVTIVNLPEKPYIKKAQVETQIAPLELKRKAISVFLRTQEYVHIQARG